MKLETLSLLLFLGGSTAVIGCDIDLGDFEGDGDTDADDDDDDDDDGESESGGSSGSAEGGSGSSGDPSSGSTTDDGSADASSGGESGENPEPGVCEAQTADCDTCLDCAIDGGSCSAAFDACLENLECLELISCYDTCAFESDTDGCMVSCDGMHGGGVGDAEAFLSCATAECGTWCE